MQKCLQIGNDRATRGVIMKLFNYTLNSKVLNIQFVFSNLNCPCCFCFFICQNKPRKWSNYLRPGMESSRQQGTCLHRQPGVFLLNSLKSIRNHCLVDTIHKMIVAILLYVLGSVDIKTVSVVTKQWITLF